VGYVAGLAQDGDLVHIADLGGAANVGGQLESAKLGGVCEGRWNEVSKFCRTCSDYISKIPKNVLIFLLL
jgi:hypothetical protein